MGGADARHFHPISQIPPGDLLELQGPRSASAGEGGSIDLLPADDDAGGSGVSGGDKGGVSGGMGDGGARVTRRVLCVHTGGVYASSGVSLPVPRSERGGGGDGARENGEEVALFGDFLYVFVFSDILVILDDSW